MGYLRHKYTRGYFLQEDERGNPTKYGVSGAREFKEDRIRDYTRLLLSYCRFEGKTVLDLGFGRGEALRFAKDSGAAKLVGVDFSEAAVQIAQDYLQLHHIDAELHGSDALSFLQEYSESASPRTIDIVLMLDFVEHVPRSELTQILSQLHKVLSPHSVLVIETPVFKVDNDVIADGLDPRSKDTSDEYDGTSGMHCNRYTKLSLREYMFQNGYYALSNHVFVPNLVISSRLLATRHAWSVAVERGYPLQRQWDDIEPEHAMTFEEFAHLSQKGNIQRFAKRATRYGKRIIRWGLQSLGVIKPRAISHDGPSWVSITGGPLEGRSLFVAPNNATGQMCRGDYDAHIYDYFDQHNGIEGGVIWDIGAHIGYHTLGFAALCGSSGRVIAFEPNPFNIERLGKNIERNSDLSSRITVLTCAISDEEGLQQFVFSSDVDHGLSSGSHLAQALAPENLEVYDSFARKDVEVSTVDGLVRSGRVPPPTLMKIDVEGAEHLVIAGATETLRIYKPILFVEIHNSVAREQILRELAISYNVEDMKLLNQDTQPYILARSK